MSDLTDYLGGSWFSDYEENLTNPPTSAANTLLQQLNYITGGSFSSLMDDWRNTLEDGSVMYNSYAGVDIVAGIVLPDDELVTLGELQTLSYSIHRENSPVRLLGHVSPAAFVKGARTIAGSMVFTVFNNYAFYRLRQFQNAIQHRLYPVADMLPPFDMVITFANEFGVFSKMSILGVTLVDEGGTMSIDDLIQEQTFSYMARGIQPMTGYYVPETRNTGLFDE